MKLSRIPKRLTALLCAVTIMLLLTACRYETKTPAAAPTASGVTSSAVTDPTVTKPNDPEEIPSEEEAFSRYKASVQAENEDSAVAAAVNGESISTSLIDQQKAAENYASIAYLHAYEQEGMSTEWEQQRVQLQQTLSKTRQEYLDETIRIVVLEQEAKKQGYVLTEDERAEIERDVRSTTERALTLTTDDDAVNRIAAKLMANIVEAYGSLDQYVEERTKVLAAMRPAQKLRQAYEAEHPEEGAFDAYVDELVAAADIQYFD
ncbi:MAG: hypothetical protein ACOYJY_06090 [Acutalibacteraceae bacterium]|jgi:hypothetical protein